jgi:hypothetical protein
MKRHKEIAHFVYQAGLEGRGKAACSNRFDLAAKIVEVSIRIKLGESLIGRVFL